MLRIFFNFCHFAVEVFTWQRSTREQGYPVVSYPQSFRIQIQSIRTQFEYPWALVLPLSPFTVYTFKPVYDAYCSMLPCHVSEVRGEVMDIIRHLTMLHPVATFLYGADWLLQRVTQTPAPDVKSMVQSYFWIKLSSVITFQPPQPVSETSLQALRREWFFAQNYEIMTLWGPELWEPTRYLQGNPALLDSWQTTRTRLKYFLGVKRGSCSAENRPNLSWMNTCYYPKLALGEVVCLHSI